MKNGTAGENPDTLHMQSQPCHIPHTEKIEKFMFAKKVIRQQENGEFSADTQSRTSQPCGL